MLWQQSIENQNHHLALINVSVKISWGQPPPKSQVAPSTGDLQAPLLTGSALSSRSLESVSACGSVSPFCCIYILHLTEHEVQN